MKNKEKDRRFGHHFVDFYSSSLSYGRKKRSRIRYLNWATELFGYSDEEIEKKASLSYPMRTRVKLLMRKPTRR